MLNFPDTVARAERSFSKLKLIKTFNRSHMTNCRLSSLAMLSIETSCLRYLELDDVIRFCMPKDFLLDFLILLYNVTLFMIFAWLFLCNICYVCYCATIQWFLLFCWMTMVRQLSSPTFFVGAESGADPARNFRGGDFSNIWQSSLQVPFWIVQNHGEKSFFRRF